MNNPCCENCKLFFGDCGYHMIDVDNHIRYEYPDFEALDTLGICKFYVRRYPTLKDCINAVETSNIEEPFKSRIIERYLKE